MKKAMELLMQFKFVWGLFYAASIIIYTIVGMFLGKTSMEFTAIWQLVIVTVALVLIQYLIFGEFTLKQLSMRGKFFLHFMLFYFMILMFISVYGWIDFGNLSNLGIFTGVYIFFYLGIINSLYWYYKATGEELNSKLAIYKQNKNVN